MNLKTLAAGTILSLALVGCGDNSTKPATAPAPAGPTTATMMSASLQAQADKIITEVGTYIKDKNWTLADQGVAELDKMKGNLPPEYGAKIDQLKQGLAAAKTAAGNLPGVPKAP